MTDPLPDKSAVPVPLRRAPGHSFLRFRRRDLGIGAMAFAGVITCMPAIPASAGVIKAEAVTASFQSVTVATGAALPEVARGNYEIQLFTTVQSPVPASTAVSSGFGYRIPPCAACSSYHEGVDYLPGAGTPVLAIADGVVADLGNPSGSLGVYVTVTHLVDGVEVSSTYAHLAYGSMPFARGDRVARGQVVGAVGSSGQSTGPHLYFQLRLADGRAIDPLPWLAQHVNV